MPGHRADCTDGLPVLLAFTVCQGDKCQARRSIKTGHGPVPWESMLERFSTRNPEQIPRLPQGAELWFIPFEKTQRLA